MPTYFPRRSDVDVMSVKWEASTLDAAGDPTKDLRNDTVNGGEWAPTFLMLKCRR